MRPSGDNYSEQTKNEDYKTVAESVLIEHLALHGGADGQVGDEAIRDRARFAIAAAVEAGVRFTVAPAGQRLFNSIETINTIRRLGLAGRNDFWERDWIATERRRIWNGRAEGSHAAPPLRETGPRRYRVKLRRSFDTTGLKVGDALRLRLPRPIESAWCREIMVELAAPADLTLRIAQDLTRVEAHGIATGAPFVALDLVTEFTSFASDGANGGESLRPDDLGRYLEHDVGDVQEIPRLREMTNRMRVRFPGPEDAIRALWDLILGNFVFESVDYGAVALAGSSVGWALDHRAMDCHVGSTLFVALCRTMGIPARIVSGYLLYDGYPSYHYWIEAYVPPGRWLSYDLMAWDLSLAGRDAAWADYFFGYADHRMRTQCLPTHFTGLVTGRLIPPWQILMRRYGDSVETTYISSKENRMYYSDLVSVERIHIDNRNK